MSLSDRDQRIGPPPAGSSREPPAESPRTAGLLLGAAILVVAAVMGVLGAFTGIGGGAVVNGHLVHGLVHPEMGHLRIPHDLEADDFAGVCPYHGDCLEGLASGPAIAERWGRPPEGLPEDHPAWELEATYLGLAVANLVCTLSPQLIIMGGGVMEQPRLLPLVRRKVLEVLNGYVQHPDLLRHIDSYIVPPGLGDRAGVLGAIALAQTTR